MSIEDRQDKMTNDADWKDGMNAFRLQVIESLSVINEAIKKLQEKLKENK